MKHRILLMLILILLAGCGKNEEYLNPGDVDFPWLDFEEPSGDWLPVSELWDKNDSALTASFEPNNALAGARSLKLAFHLNNVTGATFINDNIDIRDWHEIKALVVDLNNLTEKKLYLTFCISTGDEWIWQELVPLEIKPGITRNLRLDISGGLLSSYSGWKNMMPLIKGDFVRRIGFRVSGVVGTKGDILLDNLRIVK